MNGVPKRLRHFVDRSWGDVQLAFRVWLHLVAQRRIAHALAGHFALEHHNPVHEAFGTWRTAGYVDVHRDDAVDALYDRVVVEHAAGGGARAHRDAPLGLRHLLP